MMSSYNDLTEINNEINGYNQKTCTKSKSFTGAGDNHSPDGGQPLDSVSSDKSLQLTTSNLMPVSELQELCAKSGLRNPEYRLARTEGNCHSPIFTIKVFLNDVEIGEGMAKSKKEGRHRAAKKALVAIKEQQILTNTKAVDPSIELNKLHINDSDHCDSNCSLVSSDGPSPDVNGSANLSRNAVSVLQELCARNCFNLPDYQLSDQMGSCHEPVFTYSCQVVVGAEPIIGKASGKTKQWAKRASAEQVLKMIDERGIPLYVANDIKKKTRTYGQNNSSNSEQMIAYKETLDLMESLHIRPDLDHLLEATGDEVDYSFRFNLIAEKLGCFAKYIPFSDENSSKNKYKCLLQMKRSQSQALSKRLPIFVSWGKSSVSAEHAMQMAAQKAIIMVKVLKM